MHAGEEFYVDPVTRGPQAGGRRVRHGDEIVAGALGMPQVIATRSVMAPDLVTLRVARCRCGGAAEVRKMRRRLTVICRRPSVPTARMKQVRNAMIDKLDLRADSVVLETGAGTGP